MSQEDDRRALLRSLYRCAVAEAGPQKLARELPRPPAQGRLILLAAGKAGAQMGRVALDYYADKIEPERLTGAAVVNKGSAVDLGGFELIEAGHPVPDEQSKQAAERFLQIASEAQQDDTLLLLLSGGASALLSAPVEGVSLAQKQELTRTLLHSGAGIGEINCVRKHLSRIKGGRLARAVGAGRFITLAISDVVGDDATVIASGPSVGDPSTLADARAVIKRYGIEAPQSIALALADPANETPKPQEALFHDAARYQYHCFANGKTALDAAADQLRGEGFEVLNLGDSIEGEAREVAAEHARLARKHKQKGERLAILSGGELTVTIKGGGKGGPSQEYALALLHELQGEQGICALAADTDGCDGGKGLPTDAAGAFVFASSWQRAEERLLNPATFLQDNDSGSFFEQLGDLLVTGPTHTNVNDLRIVLIEAK